MAGELELESTLQLTVCAYNGAVNIPKNITLVANLDFMGVSFASNFVIIEFTSSLLASFFSDLMP